MDSNAVIAWVALAAVVAILIVIRAKTPPRTHSSVSPADATGRDSSATEVAEQVAEPARTENSNPSQGGLFSLKGRIGRAPYWAILVTLFIFSFGVRVTVVTNGGVGYDSVESMVAGWLFTAVGVWVLAATYVKRTHDLDMSGWYAIGGFVPILNFIVVPVLGFVDGTEGSNRFGADPLGRSARETDPNAPKQSVWDAIKHGPRADPDVGTDE